MLIRRFYSLLAALSFTCLTVSAQVPSSQPGTQRPTSDQSTAAPNHVGTTYLLNTRDVAAQSEMTKQTPTVLRSLQVGSYTRITADQEAFEAVPPPTDLSYTPPLEQVARMAAMTGQPAPLNAQIEAHTTYLVLVPRRIAGELNPAAVAPRGETPESLRKLYQIPEDGGSDVIAIVDAFHYPTIEADLGVFDRQYLPQLQPCTSENQCLTVINLGGNNVNCGWMGEEALDVQWVHAIAPKAKIIVVEAKSSSLDDMFAAVSRAASAVTNSGTGEVSMSWGTREFVQETSYESAFIDGPLFFASSGDEGGVVSYPASSPKVIAVGGTSILRDDSGNFISEVGWSGSGGGYSGIQSIPPFQQHVPNIIGNFRSVPDIAANADPYSGVPVYTSQCGTQAAGFRQIGGTSLAAPMVAAMANIAGLHRHNATMELGAIYGNASVSARIRDITSGLAGGNAAIPGYDRVTGVGVPASMDFDKQ